MTSESKKGKQSRVKSKDILKRSRDSFKSLVLLLTVFALILAIIQLRNSSIQLKDTEDLRANLNEISNYVSTQFVGKFPKNMIAINKLVDETEESLYIVVDFLSYGHFSNPKLYEEYKNKILKKKGEGIEVRITCYNADRAKDARSFQFEDFKEVKKSAAFKQYIEWYERFKEKEKIDDEKAFFKRLKDANADFKKELLNMNVEVNLWKYPLPIFIWLSDGKKAIISFYNYNVDPKEVSFYTKDTDLIKYLKKMVAVYFEPSSGNDSTSL